MEQGMITLEDFYKKHQKLAEGEIILDVRTPQEYASGHIPGSKNINHEEVLDHLSELKKYKKIYIHCRRGGRAKAAYQELANAGLTNLECVYDAGMDLWQEKGYPVDHRLN